MKIAIIVSHPIQHFCPMYASWAKNKNIKLKVFFASNIGAVAYHDNSFGHEIKWGNLYLDEFDHCFLNGDKTLAVNKTLDAPNLGYELNNFKPDIVIQYGRIYRFNQRLRRWLKEKRVKSAYISDSEDRHIESPIIRRIKHFWYSIFFRSFDYFLTVGDANEEFYRNCKVPSEKFIRMNFSIDLRLYEKYRKNKEQHRSEFRNKNNIPKDAIVISIVGKLVEMKNHIQLIKVLKKLEELHKEKTFYLLIAGSGPSLDSIRKESLNLIKNKVKFLNFVSPENLPLVYCASDLYIQPSQMERHSLAVSEAIYLGLPIIVSNTSGSYGETDDVQLGINGSVYSLGNIQELTQRIIEIIISEETIKKYEKNSLEISYRQQKICHSDVVDVLVEKFH
jgi:glycosyltransferase involved in cell wall biosynthesis